ncbi:MAG: NAD(P)H-dependent glycerol-3-phosphate dehydrogenase [Actinomycetota bacterium]
MPVITIFGAGAMGTALAISLARKGEQVTLWGSEFDARVLPDLIEKRSHPALPTRLPDELRVAGPDELEQAAKGATIGVMAAHSGGARSLAGLVGGALEDVRIVVSLAKGLEPETRKRMTEVYTEELGKPVVAVGGPALAAEVAEGLPCTAVLACENAEALRETKEAFGSDTYLIHDTSDCAGLEYCTTAKNVGAIGAGIVEGMGMRREQAYKNARAALFTQSVHEMADLVEGLGGRRETALGLAGMGDLLVTSLGGRNRQYGEMVGSGADPKHAEEDMKERGMTVEGTESARDVHDLAKDRGLDLPIHDAVYRVVHEGAPPADVLEALR